MGCDLKELVVKKEKELTELQGFAAVDAFNTLYQFVSIIRQPDGSPLMDSSGRVTSHLSGLFYRTCNLLEKKIIPVFVFDGTPSDLKKRTIAERVERKQEAEEEMKKALESGDVAKAGRLAQRTSKITREMISESKTLLSYLGLPFVEAPSEGEAQCAVMAADGIVRAAASQDYDSLLFGAPTLIRNLTLSGKKKLPRRNQYVQVYPEEILLQETLNSLEITREKLVWIGILSGTDFNPGIHGIGPKKALKLVKEFDSFEDILKKIGEDIDFEPVQELFLNPPSKKISKEELKLKEVDKEAIIQFMHEERDFSLERIENSLARAFNEPLDKKQSSLKNWFG
ncbi:flap endonuclease-1 [Candidatus Micrarchaeota archaeon]|nr:flap endonuclease-1 [Candidatus Micrarchaeota archaeon]